MAKILVISGHGAGDPGACKNGYAEAELTREFANILAPKLRQYAIVDIYDQNRDAFEDCKVGRFNIRNDYTYVFEIHFNSAVPSAHGTEMFVVHQEDGITVEQSIMKRMGKYFTIRDNDSVFDGVKRENYAVINRVKGMGMSGALFEVCFMSNADDMATYQDNKNAIATDIAEAIAQEFGLSVSDTPVAPIPTPAPTPVEPNAPTVSHVYSIGDKVRFSTCYTNANDSSESANYILANDMSRDNGTITKIVIVKGKSIYLLDHGLCWVNDGDIREVINASTPPVQPSAGNVTFPQSGGTWNVYPLNRAPVYGNQIGQINPGYYGDLTYTIVDRPQSGVVTIDTESFGRVNVYASISDGVRFN